MKLVFLVSWNCKANRLKIQKKKLLKNKDTRVFLSSRYNTGRS